MILKTSSHSKLIYLKKETHALLKAVTVNEELINIGYTLSPEDTVRLAVSPDIDGFVQRIREYAGDVKAEPMYPDFPDQVMKMNEAQFRFHQMIHYLSTYGVEDIFGVKVSKGWLPETENKSEKTQADNKLLDEIGICSVLYHFYPVAYQAHFYFSSISVQMQSFIICQNIL